jgi:hypothetical protein
MNDRPNLKQIEVEGAEFPNARQAVAAAREDEREVAIRLAGKHLVVSQEAADRLAELGLYFAYLCEHRGRIMTVPVNG